MQFNGSNTINKKDYRYVKKNSMIITALIITFTVLTAILVLFRVLRGESFRDIKKEIKELKAQDVPHYFLKSLKIVFSFKMGQKRRRERKQNGD